MDGNAASYNSLVAALEAALPILQQHAEISGYGFARPENPHNFFPDHESCSEEEISNHKAACEAWDKGEYVRDTSGGWVSPNLHVLKAPWGIGSYTEEIPEVAEVVKQIATVLGKKAA